MAEMIEPASKIFSDKNVAGLVKAKDYINAIKIIITKYKKETVTLLALSNGQKPSEYKANIVDMMKQLMDILNNKDLMQVFGLQELMVGVISSTPVTENTEETEEA